KSVPITYNKAQTINALAKSTELSKVDAEKILNAWSDFVIASLKNGDAVMLKVLARLSLEINQQEKLTILVRVKLLMYLQNEFLF
ncbi:MAG: hypothetical protein HON94_07850, partial [Methylococcales bacterium]|nr:hypothetical protein [Methylococcales bacterium]